MRILADENIETVLSEWLSSAGHDVRKIAASDPGLDDRNVLGQAIDDDRVLITYDRDFGDITFRQQVSISGVILLRFNSIKVSERLVTLQRLWPQIVDFAHGTLIVVSDDHVRIRRIVRENGFEGFPFHGGE